MKIGTYYYPEQWPREQWERDFDNIAKMGLQVVHMGEFAWFSLEPKPGEFQFDWLDTAIEMARRRSLDVILCSPTAAPPIWLAHDHPDSLPMDEHGVRARFGGRRHYSPVSPSMIDATRQIVTALADRYGNHPSVIGWQIDNEYGGSHDQSPAAHIAFRAWLRGRYKSIAELNRAWGNQFWNAYYTDFEQIQFPPSHDPKYGNPHQHLDAQRFWSHAFAQFNKTQSDILRRKIGDRFITTNFMPFYPPINPADMSTDLTLMSWDSYPVTGWEKCPPDEGYRVADPDSIGIMHDYMRSFHDRWALMEVQPGQTNWSGVPVLLHPGAVRLWLWTAYAHGAEFITTYRYRQPRFGIEMFHHGLVGTDGVKPSAGGREFAQVIEELKLVQSSALGVHQERLNPEPQTLNPSVGLMLDFDQLWYFRTLPQAKSWDYPAYVRQWYAAAMKLGLTVQILHPDRPWPSELKIIVAPAMQMVDEALLKRWDDFATAGGHLLLTCRTALMDRTGQFFEGPTAAPILEMIGGTIEAYDSLPEGAIGQIEMDGKVHEWNTWGDLLCAEPGTRTLARYANHFYKGAAAVLLKSHGSGTVTYCGVNGSPSLADAMMTIAADSAKLTTTPLPARVHILERDGFKIALNYQLNSVEVPTSARARFLIGSRTVEPVSVAVWID